MFLIFDDSEIINLDNVVSIEAYQKSEDEIEVIIATTAIRFYSGDGVFSAPNHYNLFSKTFIIKKEKWFELLNALKKGQAVFVCS